MTTLQPAYGGSAVTLTITTGTLATDPALLAGRQSNIANNTSDLGDDVMLGLSIAAPGSAPTAGTVIEVWLFGSWDLGTTFSGGAAAGGDANLSLASLGVKQTMVPLTVINQTTTTAQAYNVGPFPVATLFNGTMPSHWGVFIVHNLGVNLGATTIKYTVVKYTNT